MHSDPISDMLTRVRNAYRAKHATVDVPHSKIKEGIAGLLRSEGVIADVEVVRETAFPTLRLHLRYDSKRRPVLRQLKRISKPGLRVYKSARELRPVRSGMATQIVSTNQGLMTDREARKRRIGGEILCEIW